MNCLLMYTDYQKTVVNQGQKVVSFARFIHTVIDVCFHVFKNHARPENFCFVRGESDQMLDERLRTAQNTTKELYVKDMLFKKKK